jgi:hypothetical protein
MEPYSPFSKPFRELTSIDLLDLRRASEGWYVEYKQQLVDTSALAKSLSAFANTHGGWLFIGVKEESKDNPVAGAFPGISIDDVDKSMKWMRQAAAETVNPAPHFEFRVFRGPQAELGLSEDRAVVCAWIPRSSQAPHVHKSGKIYRRVADSSEPRAENDRFVLDQLWRRGDEVKARHEQWFDRDPEFSKAESDSPFIRLMLTADPWGERDLWIDSSPEEIRKAFGAMGPSGPRTTLPFDTVYRSPVGYTARQLVGNDLHNHSLTWRLNQTLVSDVIIPIPVHQYETSEQFLNTFNGYEHIERYIRILKKYKVSTLKIVDLNFLFFMIQGVAEIQDRLCELANWPGNYHLKAKLLNSWRTAPFIDTPAVLSQFEDHGPPMCLDSASYIPRGTGPNGYIEIARPEQSDPTGRLISAGMQLFSPIAMMYGIPAWLNEAPLLDGVDFYEELTHAGNRAMDVQRLRNLRSSTS